MTSTPRPESLGLHDLDGLRMLAASLLRAADGCVDDVVHDAWLRAAAGAGDDAPRPRRWWSAVLRNTYRSRLRAEALRAEHERAAAVPLGGAADGQRDDPAHATTRLETARILLRAVTELDEPYRTAITLRYLDGLSPREIAGRTDCPVRTVHTHLQRGLAILRGRLEGRFGADGDRRAWLVALAPLGLVSGKQATTGWLPAVVAVALALGTCWVFLVPSQVDTPPPTRTVTASTMTAEAQPGRQRDSSKRAPDERTVAPAPAASPAPAGQPGADSEVVLRGLVIDLAGVPVAGVRLVHGGSSRPPRRIRPAKTTESDAEGRFQLPIGPFSSGGLFVIDDAWAAVYRPRLYTDSESPPPLTVVVAPRRQIGGRVLDAETLAPLAGATLRVVADAPPQNHFDRDLSLSYPADWTDTSDADGRFDFGSARLSGERLLVELDGYESLRVDPTELAPERPLVLRRSRGMLTGTVLDSQEVPAARAVVLCGELTVRADQSGRFSLDLLKIAETPDGAAHPLLIAARQGELPATLHGPEDRWREAEAWPSPLVLRLGDRPLEIRGQVVEADGTPVEGVRVRALDEQPLGTDRTLEFLARATAVQRSDRLTLLSRDADLPAGEFRAAGLRRRSYRLRVEHQGSLRAVVTGPIEAGTTGLRIELPTEPTWGRIGGTVVDRRGRPVFRAWIRIVRDDPELTLTLGSDPEGRFRSPAPVARGANTLLVQHPRSPQPTRIDLRQQADPGALHLVVPVVAQARVVSTPMSRTATRLRLFDAGGELLLTYGFGAGLPPQTVQDLHDGRSATFSVLESAATAVLELASGGEVRREVDLSDYSWGQPVELRF